MALHIVKREQKTKVGWRDARATAARMAETLIQGMLRPGRS